jgi:hypothetical protein
MNIDLTEEALAYGATVRQALRDAGGDQLVQEAEREPAKRGRVIAPVLAELGTWDLEPRTDPDDLEAAAAACRAAKTRTACWWWPAPARRPRSPASTCAGRRSPSTASAAR